jgi:D-beta-D-heptose 7-phosphate kinase/D-beta-D-heptose 1-phosphate adenosyltransferase
MSFEGDLSGVIAAWQERKVLVVGDAMTDVYHFGRVERISQEAPVPIFVEEREERRPGGAGNVALNLAALGCVPSFYFAPQPWCEKHRYIAGHHQLLRVDFDHRAEQPTISFELNDLIEEADAIVLSDYAKGWLNPELCQYVITYARTLRKPVIVDPKGKDWSKYTGASVICPNQQEFELALGDGSQYPGSMLVKRGDRGITALLYEPEHHGHRIEEFPAVAKHVYDVTGAGDTVVAVIAATLAAGGDLLTGAYLANLAAGYVVGEIGTASCSKEQLQALARKEVT